MSEYKLTQDVQGSTHEPVQDRLYMNQQSYDFFAKMFNQAMKIMINPHLMVDRQNNWHKSHPFYRINGYRGIQVSQSFGLYFVMNPDFLKMFDTIIEIGTYNGGLTLYVKDNSKPETKVVSYDIDGSINHAKKHIPNIGIDFRVEDSFAEDTFKDIVEMIQSEGKCLVLCDGGDKPKEFNTFSKYLKSGDHIMCHDYCKTPEIWDFATTFWQWPYATDTNYDDIKDTIEREGLEEYKHDAFAFVFWGSYRKK